MVDCGCDIKFLVVSTAVVIRATAGKVLEPVQATGKAYRRTLPIDYYETANGLVLRGENLDGSVSQLVFYTPRGMQRMQDLTGGGPDEDPCGTHS